jgi:hypothetical protein
MIILVLSRFLIIYALFIHKVLSRYLDLVFFIVTAGGLYVFFFFSQISLKFCSFNKGKLGIVRPHFFFSYIKLSVPCLGSVDRIDKRAGEKNKVF